MSSTGAIAVIILLLALVPVAIYGIVAVTRGVAGFPRCELSRWKTDGQGGWRTQPVLTIRGQEFRFDTPEEYIRKLRDIEQLLAQYPHADAGNLYQWIDEFERVQHHFIRHPSANAPGPAESGAVAANASWTGPPANQTQAVVAPAPPLLFVSGFGEIGNVPVADPVKSPRGTTDATEVDTRDLAGDCAPVANAQRCYSPELRDTGRMPFANAVRAFYSNNGTAFTYWLERVLARGTEDAYAHVACQWRFVWSKAVLLHYKIVREFFGIDAIPPEMVGEVEEALVAVDRLVSYDQLAPLRQTTIDSRFVMPVDALESIEFQINSLRNNSYPGCEDQTRQEMVAPLFNGRAETRLNWSVGRLLCDPGTEKSVEMPLGDVAGLLATLSKVDEEAAPALADLFRSLALNCAAKADPSAVDYATVISSFKIVGLAVPEPTPQMRAPQGWRVSVDGALFPDVPGAAPGATPGPVAVESAEDRERQIRRGVERSLNGLVGLERFAALLGADISDFLSGPRQSCGRVIWGNSGVGKTEVAQRLAGLREGFPGLRTGSGTVEYVSGVDGKLEIKEIVDRLAPFTILFIDEADKCLDPKAGMVNQAEATQLCHAVVTHFQRKPVFWAFLGVFSNARAGGRLTDEIVRSTFGDELAHRLDYADWEMPTWSLENLLKAVNGSAPRRRLQYDDDAVLTLAEYCIRTNGGVRAFDNLETALLRRFRMGGQAPTVINIKLVRELLEQRGVSSV